MLHLKRTAHTLTAAAQYMGIFLYGADILMPKQLLSRTNIITGFQQMRGETMTQCVTRGLLEYARDFHCLKLLCPYTSRYKYRMASKVWLWVYAATFSPTAR